MTKKVAVSLPDSVFRELERARRGKRLSRSAAVQHALILWARDSAHERHVCEYVESYQRTPEASSPAERAAWLAVEAWGPPYEE